MTKSSSLSIFGRIGRSVLLAFLGATVVATVTSRQRIVLADTGSSCQSSAAAVAVSYDGSALGTGEGSIDVTDNAVETCVGLGQTNAIFQAGLACENAGIPSGVEEGLGYAVVDWYIIWIDGSQFVITGPDQPQQYDCGDTFS